jgi:hypothetical protein
MEKIVDLLCWKCKRKIGQTIRRRGEGNIVGRKLCVKCYGMHILSMVIRNKEEKMRRLNSLRMTKKNPMFDKNVSHQQSETLKRRYAKGDLVSPFQDAKNLSKYMH